MPPNYVVNKPWKMSLLSEYGLLRIKGHSHWKDSVTYIYGIGYSIILASGTVFVHFVSVLADKLSKISPWSHSKRLQNLTLY